MEQKTMKMFLIFKIISFEQGETNFRILEEDTGHWQSICYEATLRFNISLMEVYFRPGSLRVTEKQDESALMQILQEVGSR